MSFTNYKIDDRILKSIKKLGWKKPTKVQEESLEKAINKQDLLIQSKTGSGKTAIYTIAIFENILREYNEKIKNQLISIVIVPSKELCTQVSNTMETIGSYCMRFITIINLGNDQYYEEYMKNKNEENKIIIGTPSRIIPYLKLYLKNELMNIKHIIFDEADLLFGYGYKEKVEELTNLLCDNKSQTIIVSATLNDSVNEISKLILKEPIKIKPNESLLPNEIQLSQYIIKCEKKDKFLILYALLKLALLKGRFIIFVNDITTAFKIRLFFENFGINSCVLNNELPFNSRYHIVEYFNSGKLDILIALDKSTLINESNKEYSSSRGIDFVKVDNIINFNFPLTITSYIHRVGRTARANNTGLALSFVSPDEYDQFINVEKFLEEKVEITLRPFSFRIDIVEGFRYRVDDALYTITKPKILAARRAEIKREILNSKKLDEYFKKNPNDKIAIKHDFNSQNKFTLQSMKFIPDYLIPDALKSNIAMIPSAKLRKSQLSVGKIQRFKKAKINNPLKSLKR